MYVMYIVCISISIYIYMCVDHIQYYMHSINYTTMKYVCIYIMYGCVYIYIYGKCLGFARNRNHNRQRIIIIIITTTIITIITIIIIIIIIIKPLSKIFNECRSLTGVGELNLC